jgi:hypothetical protein
MASNKRKLKRLKNLFHKHVFKIEYNLNLHNKKKFDKKLIDLSHKKIKEEYENALNYSYPLKYINNLKEIMEFFELLNELELDKEKLFKTFLDIRNRKSVTLFSGKYKRMPNSISRDNKDSYNYGSLQGNKNKVRYPSKKRSLRVWRNFYNLFPYHAEKDGWDGKTSSRYPGNSLKKK